MLDYFHLLFSYDDWANREVLSCLHRVAQPPARSVKLLAHILGTEYLWFSRIGQQRSRLPVWPELDLAQCEEHVAHLARTWSDYLRGLSRQDLSRSVPYRNSQGEPWTNSIQDILMHVVMHSAYHRGQIASHMRQAGYTPAYTDFIHAIRQGHTG